MITLPLEAVSTFVPASYFFEEGQKWFDPAVMGIGGTTKPLNLADLACPTFGVGKSTAPDGTVETTYGAPYLPIIIPPRQLTTLDPVWQKSCTEIYSIGEFLKSFAIVDPPRILQPAAAIGPASPAHVPAIETPVLQPLRTNPNASPVSNAGKILPAATLAPDNNRVSNPKDSNPTSDVPNPDVHHLDNRPTADLADPSKFNPLLKPHNPDEILTNTKAFDIQKQKLAEPLSSNSQAVKTPDPNSAHPNDPNYVSVQQSGGPSLGELIIGVLNGAKLGSAVDGIANSGRAESDDGGRTIQKNQGDPAPQNHPPQSPKTFPTAGQAFEPVQSPGVFVAAGLLFTPLLSSQGVAIYGKTVVPGGSAVTFAEVPVSLDLSGGLQVGSSLFIVPTPAVPEVRGGAAFSGAGFSFTSLPISSEGSAINMQTLVPGGGGASKTVSKTNINFNPPGSLHLGSFSTPLPTSAPSNSDEWLITANGLAFTFLSSGKKLVIDSQTLVPGGFSATVSGTRIFLDGTRGLHVGSSPLIYLPTPAPDSVGVAVFTAGGLEFTSLSSANGVVVINGQTLTAGGLPIAISGSFISLDSTDGIHVGSSLIVLPTQVPSFQNSVFIASGFKFTSLPSLRVAIDGQTLSPGGSPVTVLGTRVSLDPTGGLHVGSWLIAHSTSTPDSEELEIYSNGGGFRPLTRLPHLEIVIGSTTIFRGRATANTIISGTPMSSNPSETLSQAGGTSIVFNSSPTGSNSSLAGVFFSGQGSRLKGAPYRCLVGVVSGMYFLFYWI